MVTTKFEIDSTQFKRNMLALAERTPSITAKALSRLAGGIRKRWLEQLSLKLDRPKPFSKKVFNEDATPSKQEAFVFIPDIQSEYLRYMVRGEARRGGELATTKDGVLSITKNTVADLAGGFPEGPHRWLGKIIGGADNLLGVDSAFVGRPKRKGGGEGRKAVFERTQDGGLTLIGVFVQSQQYKKTLPLIEIAEAYVEEKYQEAFAGFLGDQNS